MSTIASTSEKGKEVRAYLERALGIPAGCRWFEVRLAVGEVVSVKCEFLPQDDDTAAPEGPR